jgi:hypothetical protein
VWVVEVAERCLLSSEEKYRSEGRVWPVDLRCAVPLFCLSNNVDVEVTGVLLARFVCTSVSADEISL